jgi:hypothetical protein
MARVDDYIGAKKIAIANLSSNDYEAIKKRSGFAATGENVIQIPFLNKIYRVDYPNFDFVDEPASPNQKPAEVPLQEQVLILHYLMAPPDIEPVGKWIAYREIPGASFYFGPFTKRAIDPLKKVFGDNLSGFEAASNKLGGIRISDGDVGFEFRIFPRIPIRLILWEGDAEFAAEGNILFDESIGRLLPVEDIAWLAGMIVYRLMALSR